MRSQSILYLTILLGTSLSLAAGFQSPGQQNAFRCKTAQRQHRGLHSSTAVADTRLNLSNDKQTDDDRLRGSYNDDFFGAIFLSGFAILNDFVFAGTFLALSAAAATATNVGKLPATKRVPAAVAALTIIITLVAESIVPLDDSEQPSSWSTTAFKIGVCTASMLYGYFAKEDEESSSGSEQ